MAKHFHLNLFSTVLVFVLISMVSVPVLSANTFFKTNHQITTSPEIETQPTLGNDGISDIVVYTWHELQAGGTKGPGEIYYQRLHGGAPLGDPVQVTDSPIKDDRLNDIYGDYIVFTAFDDESSSSGIIMTYQISTTITEPIGGADRIRWPRIHGDKVVWIEGPPSSSVVLLYDLDWIGTPIEPDLIAGPIPPTSQVEIGDRFVVWGAHSSGQCDIICYEIDTGTTFTMTSTNNLSEKDPSTSGPWITWECHDLGSGSMWVEAKNFDTSEHRILSDPAALSLHPTIDGDLIAYESDLPGNFDVYLYRISTQETFQATTMAGSQYLNDIFNGNIGFVNEINHDANVWVMDFFISDGESIKVPSQAETIQDAIDLLFEDDWAVLVAPGTYTENIDFKGKAVEVRSDMDGDPSTEDIAYSTTIIDGNQAGSVVRFTQGEDDRSILNGFTITNGLAATGAGIICSADPVIKNNYIHDNTATSYGGGLFTANCSATITGNVIHQNTAQITGGGLYCHESDLTLTHNAVQENHAENSGGGLVCMNTCAPEIAFNLIAQNTAGHGGGGIYTRIATPHIENNVITNNGPVKRGGGIYVSDSPAIVAGNLFSGNLASLYGGGIYITASSLTLINNTISGNDATTYGGGIFADSDSTLVMTNSIVWDNTAGTSPELRVTTGTTTASFCNIKGGFPEGTNILDQDPLFENPAFSNYHLTKGSPCINRGTNAVTPLLSNDMDGDDRVHMGTVDMGADEFTSEFLFLEAEAFTLSAATGDTIGFTLYADTENAYKKYGLIGSVTGTIPGMELPKFGIILPINWDWFTEYLVFPLINTPVFDNFLGELNGMGRTDATLFTGPLPPEAIGRTMHFAYFTYKPFDMASNPVQVEILP